MLEPRNAEISGAQEILASEGSRSIIVIGRDGCPPDGVLASGAYMNRWPSNLGGPSTSIALEVPTSIDARFVEGVS